MENQKRNLGATNLDLLCLKIALFSLLISCFKALVGKFFYKLWILKSIDFDIFASHSGAANLFIITKEPN